MALDKTRLANGIIANIETLNPDLNLPNKAIILPYWEAISDALITEIKDNLEVITTVSVPGVQSGSDTVTGSGKETEVR